LSKRSPNTLITFPGGGSRYVSRDKAKGMAVTGTAVRGQSCRVGTELAEACRRREPWALVALEEIRDK